MSDVNESEYLIIYTSGRRRVAMLLDANLERIAEYRAFSDEVVDLLKEAKQLGPLDESNWGKLAEAFSPIERESATAYRLHV